MVFTSHAQGRKCQRSLPTYVVDATYKFGFCRPVRGGVLSYILDKEAVRLASDIYPRAMAGNLSRYLGTYVIVGEYGRVVTAARGKCRFPRK